MTDEEKKRVLQIIFTEVRADHTLEFRPRPIWEPYVEAVLARQRQERDALIPVTTSERKTGRESPRDTFVAAGILFRAAA